VIRRVSRLGAPWHQAVLAIPLVRYVPTIEPRWLARGVAAFGTGFALGLASTGLGLLP
jgi:hypothetical protein